VTRIAERKVIACVICEVGFTPYGRQIYCGKRCAEQGLALAVERQRQRRLQIRNATGLTEDKHEG
jgi:predicted nucleic acid-binding Zn ribbon protein